MSDVQFIKCTDTWYEENIHDSKSFLRDSSGDIIFVTDTKNLTYAGVRNPQNGIYVTNGSGTPVQYATLRRPTITMDENKNIGTWYDDTSTHFFDEDYHTGSNNIYIGTSGKILNGNNSIAIGANSSITGNNSIIIGPQNYISGNNNIAIGSNIHHAYNTSNNSIAIGRDMYIAPDSSVITMGYNNSSLSKQDIVIGYNNTGAATNIDSYISIGEYIQQYSQQYYSVILGRYNSYDQSTNIFSVGNGTKTDRHNVITITNDGTMYIVDKDSTLPDVQKPMISLQDTLNNKAPKIINPNLLKNSDFHLQDKYWEISTAQGERVVFDNNLLYYYSNNTASGSTLTIYYTDFNFTSQKFYTLSFNYQMSPSMRTGNYGIRLFSKENEVMTVDENSFQMTIADTWGYYSKTFTIDNRNYIKLAITCTFSLSTTLKIKNLKLEEGHIATLWCPHVEDYTQQNWIIYNAE